MPEEVQVEQNPTQEKSEQKLQPFMYRGCYMENTCYMMKGSYFSPETCERTRNLKTREDDVYLITYPRTGTTWTQNILYGLINGTENLGGKTHLDLMSSFPYLELNLPGTEKTGCDIADKMESPRLLKSHLPQHLCPQDIISKRRKVVVILRNPKDTCISCYNFYKDNPSLNPFQTGTMKEFFPKFLSGRVAYGSHWQWTRGWINYRKKSKANADHVLIVFYDQLQNNFVKEVARIAEFIGCEKSKAELVQLQESCSVVSMKKRYNKALKNFVRKGNSHEWKNQMGDEIAGMFDEKTKLFFENDPDVLEMYL